MSFVAVASAVLVFEVLFAFSASLVERVIRGIVLLAKTTVKQRVLVEATNMLDTICVLGRAQARVPGLRIRTTMHFVPGLHKSHASMVQ